MSARGHAFAGRADARAGEEDRIGRVFAALADPTRRAMIEAMLEEGSTSVPRLTAELPITRQAVAKHLATLDQAGLVERSSAGGREVRWQLRDGALDSAAGWVEQAEAAWGERLTRLKRSVERGPRRRRA